MGEKKGDAGGERAGIDNGGHVHADGLRVNNIGVRPIEVPSAARACAIGGGAGADGEIDSP